MKILIRNQQRRRHINKNRIIKTARRILSVLEQPTAELSILFAGDKKMSQLNALYRGKNKSTDVLSFSQTSGNDEARSKKLTAGKNTGSSSVSGFQLPASSFLLGDIVISVPRAEYQAELYGLTFYDELLRLLVHGILHLLGFDHERSNYHDRVMRKKEEEIFSAVKKMD